MEIIKTTQFYNFFDKNFLKILDKFGFWVIIKHTQKGENMKRKTQADKQTAKLIEKLNSGRVASIGNEERESDARLIAETNNHQSFINYPYFMNNRQFLLEIVKTTPRPRFCKNYFYQYINKYLKKDKCFNYEFLTEVLENFGIQDATYVANRFGLADILNNIVSDAEWRALNSAPSGKLAHIDY